MNPRTIASAIRTLLYGGITASVAVGDVEMRHAAEAALAGGVLADYVTWMMRCLFLLPAHVLHGCYDCCINVLFGWVMWRFVVPREGMDGESAAFAFLAFLLVLGVKIAYYTIKIMEED